MHRPILRVFIVVRLISSGIDFRILFRHDTATQSCIGYTDVDEEPVLGAV